MFNAAPKKITSLHNPLIKHMVRLRESKKYREEKQATVVCSIKIFKELENIQCVFATDERWFNGITIPCYLVSEEVIKKISGLQHPEGIACEVTLPQSTPISIADQRVLALDHISDPGNMGTLIRSALAFGWDRIFLLPNCVDLFNDKVIRSSMGGCFRLPYSKGNLEDLVNMSHDSKAQLYIADLEGENFLKLPQSEKTILLMGNEAHGVSETSKLIGKKIHIPMPGPMESLNVAIAGGILLYFMGKRA